MKHLFLGILNALIAVAFMVLCIVFPTMRIIASVTVLSVLLYAVYNYKRWHMMVPLVGGSMNMLAFLANGNAMPVAGANFTMDAAHSVMTAATHLKLICDIIPIGSFAVISVGDLLIITWGLTMLTIYGYNKIKKLIEVW